MQSGRSNAPSSGVPRTGAISTSFGHFVSVSSAQSVEFYKYLHQHLDAIDVNVGVSGDSTTGTEDSFRFEKIPANPTQKEELDRLILEFQAPIPA